jgi:hypothetical protein
MSNCYCHEEYLQTYLGVKKVLATPATQGDFRLSKCASTNLTFVPNDDDAREGYIVVYEDGYVSWSPKDSFEKAYRKVDNLTFGLAIEAMKKGDKVARKGWNGKGMWIELQVPDEHSKMTRPYIYMVCPKGSTKHFGEQTKDFERIPWLASQTDVLAEDWVIVDGNND